MAKSVRTLKNTTQKFIEILDIQDDIVVMSGGSACLVIEVKATNFSLLSPEEQDAKLFAYASLLNSLSFPIQVLIRSKKVDVSLYLEQLAQQAAKTQNKYLANQISLYRDFVQELVKVNTVLDKKFYITIPYSSLEKGVRGAKNAAGVGKVDENFLLAAKTSLHSKAESLHSQLQRVNLPTKTLDKNELIKLFYEIYNEGLLEKHQTVEHTTSSVISGK